VSSFWVDRSGRLIADDDGNLVFCGFCPCISEEIYLACCDSFAVCIDAATPINEDLFATVRIREGPGPGGTILASVSMPIAYTIGVTWNGFTRNGWFGCEILDPETQWLGVATVFLQCEGGEFRITFNGFTTSGHAKCDGYIDGTGTTGTVDLVASPFAISNTGVDFGGAFAPPREEDIWVEVDISE